MTTYVYLVTILYWVRTQSGRVFIHFTDELPITIQKLQLHQGRSCPRDQLKLALGNGKMRDRLLHQV